jgi:hypothetical protein
MVPRESRLLLRLLLLSQRLEINAIEKMFLAQGELRSPSSQSLPSKEWELSALLGKPGIHHLAGFEIAAARKSSNSDSGPTPFQKVKKVS